MIPQQWITIGSDVLTIVMAILVAVDSIWNLNIVSNPVLILVLAVLGAIGIKQVYSMTATLKAGKLALKK